MEKFFKIKERGSTLKTEIFAGITTFFAMAYIIFVNPNQVAAEGANGWLVGLGADPGAGCGEERGGAVRGASEVLCADGPCHDADDDREYPLRH